MPWVSAYDITVPAGGKGLVKTDISIAIPEDCYARVGTQMAYLVDSWFISDHMPFLEHVQLIFFCISAPRSGLAWKHHIDTGAGVIDADYRGNVGVILFNHSTVDFSGKFIYP